MTGTDEDGPSVFLPLPHPGLCWHTGYVPGYVSAVTHAPSQGTTVFLVVTSDWLPLRRNRDMIAERINQELQSHATS